MEMETLDANFNTSNRICIVCGAEVGSEAEMHCTRDSLVVVIKEGSFRKRTHYFTLDGHRLSEQELFDLRARETARMKTGAVDQNSSIERPIYPNVEKASAPLQLASRPAQTADKSSQPSVTSMAVTVAIKTALTVSGIALSAVIIYWFTIQQGGLLSEGKWVEPMLLGWGPTWRTLALSGIVSMFWAWLVLGKPSETIRLFLVCLLCVALFDLNALELQLNPIVVALICCGGMGLVYGVVVYLNQAATSADLLPNEDYQNALRLFETGQYREGAGVFSQILGEPDRLSHERLKEIKMMKLICLVKLGSIDEAKALLPPEDWVDRYVVDLMRSNYPLIKDLTEVKQADEVISHTNAPVSQELVFTLRRKVDCVLMIDQVYRYDAVLAANVYYHLAYQLQFVRLYDAALELLKRGLESRRSRSKQDLNPVSIERLLNMMGDIYLKMNCKRQAVDAYNQSLKLNSSQADTKGKRDRLHKELTGF
jgi:tetratricopeptide (TPR) repeat protein